MGYTVLYGTANGNLKSRFANVFFTSCDGRVSFLPACGLLWSRHGGYIFGWVESSTAAQGSASSKREVAEWIKYDDGVSQATPIDRLSGCLLEER